MSKRISFLLSTLIILFIIPCIAFSATIQLPQTGQTKCYNKSGTEIPCTGTGQDGEIQAGIGWPSPRFIGNGDGTVTDNLTGLMWVKSPDSTTRRWSKALDYCNNLNFAGHTDWRLPNVNELESLVNADVPDTATWLNTQGFTNVQSFYYWSSSTSAYNTNRAWDVNMGSGSMYYFIKGYYDDYVWPVRAGQ